MDLERLQRILHRSLLHNSLTQWIIAIAVVVAVYSVLTAIKRFFTARVKNQARRKEALAAEGQEAEIERAWAQALQAAVTRTNMLFILLLALFAGTYALDLPHIVTRGLQSVLVITAFIQSALWLSQILSIGLERYVLARAADETVTNAFSLIHLFTQLAVWTVALLLTLDNLGVNITALVAGLGVGGIAIALAAQNILGDLFASLSIVLDKPFVKGDSIALGDLQGTVEKIGLKTTRLRSLTGEQIICANTDLTGSRLRNYKRMNERRIVFGIGVTYQTTAEQLEAIPGMIEKAIKDNKRTRFDRAHFKAFNASSLDFEAVYYVLSPDYTLYMNIQQTVNLALFRGFAAQGIEFAYPTQTHYIIGPNISAPTDGKAPPPDPKAEPAP